SAHELFLADVPRSGYPREGRPLVPRGELGRSVIAQRTGDEIAVLEAIVDPREERHQSALCRRRGIGPRDGGAEVVDAERVSEVADALRHEQVAGELVVLVPSHHVEAVGLADLAPEGQEGLERPG